MIKTREEILSTYTEEHISPVIAEYMMHSRSAPAIEKFFKPQKERADRLKQLTEGHDEILDFYI